MSVSHTEPETDWQTNRTRAECNKYMLEHQIQCDVTFRVGIEGATEDIKAHKYMLISRSPVFYAMFCGLLATDDRSLIDLPDVDPDGFKEMLKYIYYDATRLNFAEHGLYILQCAKMYIIPKLAEVCTKALAQELTQDNVFAILAQSILFDEKSLRNCCVRFIDIYARDLFKLGAHVNLSREAFKMIVLQDTLYATESEVYDACVQWGQQRCIEAGKQLDRQNVFGEIEDLLRLYVVRFCHITSDELAHSSMESHLDWHAVNRWSSRVSFLRKDVDALKFRHWYKPRTLIFQQCRFTEVVIDKKAINTTKDCIDVTFTSNILLKGIMIFSMTCEDVPICVYDDERIVYKGRAVETRLSKQHGIYQVFLTKACRLKRNIRYTITVTLTRSYLTYLACGQGWSGKGEQKTMEYIGGTVTYSTSQREDNGTTWKTEGQIPGLVFTPRIHT